MKALTIIFTGIGLVLSLGSCKKIDQLTHFEMDYEAIVTIQNGTGVNIPISLYSPDIESNSEAEFSVNDTRKDKIEHIQLTDLSMEIIYPSHKEFDFLEDVEVFISADGLDEILLAYLFDIDNSVGDKIDLNCSETDFQEYIKKDKFNLRVQTVQDEMILEDVEIKINSAFFVDAEILGQ